MCDVCYSGETLDVFTHEEAVYGLSVDPVNDSVFASACDDGRILIYDIRAPPGDGRRYYIIDVQVLRCMHF